MAEEGGFPQQKLLEKCPQNQISTLLHGLIDGICGKCPPRYQDYAKIWSLEEWWNVCDYFKELAKDTLKNIWSKDEIAAHLEGLGSSKQEVLDVFWVRREDIQQHLRQETCAISRTQLVDFDWSLKLAMSSDKIASLHQPLVSVDLDVREDETKRVVSMELTKEDLQKLITSLEAANKVVNQLKT